MYFTRTNKLIFKYRDANCDALKHALQLHSELVKKKHNSQFSILISLSFKVFDSINGKKEERF